MINRFAVYLDGRGLQDLDPAVCITDVTEYAPAQLLRTSEGPQHLRVTARQRRSLTVKITFVVRERSPLRRAAILQQIAAWAQGTELTLGHRPDQRLACICTELPEPGSALKWYAPLQVTFTAFECPWWEAVQASAAWITPAVTQGSAILQPVGTAETTPVEALVFNQTGMAVHTLTLACGDTHMTFNDLGLKPGERLYVAHDSLGRLTLTILGAESRSVMHLRTPDSHDELLARCSAPNTVQVESNQPVSVKFTARGRFA